MADYLNNALTSAPYYPTSGTGTTSPATGTSGTDAASNLQQLLSQAAADNTATTPPAFDTSSFQPAYPTVNSYGSPGTYGMTYQNGYAGTPYGTSYGANGTPYGSSYSYGASPSAANCAPNPASAPLAAAKGGSGTLSPTVALATLGAFKAWRSPPAEHWVSRDLNFVNKKVFGERLPTGLQEKINTLFLERRNPTATVATNGAKAVKDLPQADKLIKDHKLTGIQAHELRARVGDAERQLQALQDKTAIQRAELGVQHARMEQRYGNLTSTAANDAAKAEELKAKADANFVRRENLPKRKVFARRRLAREAYADRATAKRLTQGAKKTAEVAKELIPSAEEQAKADAWKFRMKGARVGTDYRKVATSYRGDALRLESEALKHLQEKKAFEHTVENLIKDGAPQAKIDEAETAAKESERLAGAATREASLARATAELADSQATLLGRLPVKKAKTLQKLYGVEKGPVEENRGFVHMLGSPFRKVASLPGISHTLKVLKAIAPEMAIANGVMDLNRMSHDFSNPKASLTKKLLSATAVVGDGVGAAFWGEGLGFVGDGISMASGYEHGKVQ